MIPRPWKSLLAVLAVPALLWEASPASAGWEAGARAGFDTNLSRSIEDGEGSGYVSAYGSYWKGHAAETRLDWTMGVVIQGAVHASLSDVDYAAVLLYPGMAYIIRPGWTASLAPFLQGKAVRDDEQSAWSFGGRFGLSQKFRNGLYLGEYYVYTDSRAEEDVYSYTENTLGMYLGMRWTPKVFTEAGYEYSRGDSFLSTEAAAPPAGGNGPGRRGRRYSAAFDADVFKETVDVHAISVSAGIDWSPAWFSTANYTFRTWDGDSGSADDSSGYAGIGYRFGMPDR